MGAVIEAGMPGDPADGGTVVEGTVTHGRQLGRELGFPTANLAVGANLGLEDGVYRSRAAVAGRWYDAMSNLGSNPSVGGTERRLETHLFGFSGELYGRPLQVELLERIRGELTEGELHVFRRGRNANSATMARHAAMTDYRKATGFEALMGWLYLTGQTERLLAIVRLGLEEET